MADDHEEGHDQQKVTLAGAVPMSMLLGALWLVTLGLAGWWASDVAGNVARLTDTAGRLNERSGELGIRVDHLEAREPQHADSKDLTEIIRRLDRLEGKVDELRDGRGREPRK